MIINMKVENSHEVHIRYELEPDEIKALKELKEKNYLEYRSGKSTISATSFGYEGRNTDIPFEALKDLISNGFIEENFDAWHTEFNLTKIGKQIVEELV
jgi:hypothetical protein